MMRFIRGAFVALMLAPGAGAAQDFDAGQSAYSAGDYATALQELRPLAENGNASAQNTLGLMYSNGQGVPQDDSEAARLYRVAAEQGYAAAQFNLGFVYAIGLGIPRDDA